MNSHIFATSGNPANGQQVNLTSEPTARVPISGVDLNSVINQVFEKKKHVLQEQMAIVRCDVLPSVKGDTEKLYRLIDHLLNMIVNHPPAGTQLFIYVKCEPSRSEIIDLGISDDVKLFDISFHTNIHNGQDWYCLYNPVLQECALICKQHNGSFEANPISKSGCIFTLTIPGKFN